MLDSGVHYWYLSLICLLTKLSTKTMEIPLSSQAQCLIIYFWGLLI